MADINVERKKRGGILPWILGLLALALLLFALTRCGDDEQEVAPAAATPDSVAPATTADTMGMGAAAAPMPATDTGAAAAGGTDSIPVAQLLSAGTAGGSAQGLTRVADVVSDRGFWISQGGQRMFVVIGEPQAAEQRVDINTGQVLRMSGTVMQGGASAQVPAGVEQEAQQLIRDQPLFMMVQPADVQVVGTGT